MGNHVIRDRIWESKKLARCSRNAALAYPWIFLVADDHGRFEYDPRRIWSKVFGMRSDVSLREVAGWLDEYEAVRLLFRYHIDGALAAWTGFTGRPPTQRRESTYPDPEPFMSEALKDEARESLGDGYTRASLPLGEGLLEQSRAEQRRSGDGDGAPARSRRKAATTTAASAHTPEAVAVVEAYNAVFGTRVGTTPGNLRAAVRALEFGYTIAQIQRVFEAVKNSETESAKWCHDTNREFEYLIRPEHTNKRTGMVTQGRIDVILNELETGRKAS